MALNTSNPKKLKDDFPSFLIHLTRNGTYKKWLDIHHTKQDEYPTLNAKKSLEEIIRNNKIEARSPFGYFNYLVPHKEKNQDSKVRRSWLQSVCFIKTPVVHIGTHIHTHTQFKNSSDRSFNFQPYGLAFFENLVCSEGGSPVMYFNAKNTAIRNSLDTIPTSDICTSMKSLLPFYEAFGPPLFSKPRLPPEIDYRWQKEWRIVGDFNYLLQSNVAFGICPESEIDYFESIVKHEYPFIDPRLPIQTIKQKLKENSKLHDLV